MQKKGILCSLILVIIWQIPEKFYIYFWVRILVTDQSKYSLMLRQWKFYSTM